MDGTGEAKRQCITHRDHARRGSRKGQSTQVRRVPGPSQRASQPRRNSNHSQLYSLIFACLAHHEERLNLAVGAADGAVAAVASRDHGEHQYRSDGAARRHRHQNDPGKPPDEAVGAA